MHRLILAADPCARHEFRGHAHEPCVAVLVRGAGLAADLHARKAVIAVQAAGRTRRHHALQHRQHRIGRALADGVLRLGDEVGDHVALPVLDARHENGVVMHALVSEGREGAHQLENVRFRRAERQRRHGVDIAADTHVVNEVGDRRRLFGLLHDPRRIVVAAAGKTPAQGVHHAVVLNLARLLGRPRRAVGRLDRNGQVGHHRAGRQPQMVDGEGVDEGFDRRTDLTFALLGHVVFEVAEIGSADVRLDISRTGIERHERRPHDTLVVQDRVARSHQRIAFALVGEDLHRAGFVERSVDLLLARAGVPHLAVAVRIADGVTHDALALRLVGVDKERLGAPVLGVHAGLDDRFHLFLDGLLGIGLHRRIDRGIDLQAVAVDVVGRAVGLAVLAAPAVERILLVLLHRLIVVPLVVELIAFGTFGVHHKTQHLAEVGRRTFVVRHGTVIEDDGKRAERIALLARNGPGVLHARNDEVAAREGVVVIPHRRITRRGIHHAHQHGGLLHVQLVRLLVEEGKGRGLDAVGVGAVLHRIEVHGGDLLLGIVVFELEGRDPLLELRRDELGVADQPPAVAHRVARKEVLGQLLRDGRAAALRGVLQQHGLHCHTGQRGDVDARMGSETGVLGGDQRRDDRRHLVSSEPDMERRIVREKIGVLNVGTVLHEEGADDLAVLGIDLRGKVAAGILQLLERRHAAEQPEGGQQQHEEEQSERREGQTPDPFYRFRTHVRLFLLWHRT